MGANVKVEEVMPERQHSNKSKEGFTESVLTILIVNSRSKLIM